MDPSSAAHNPATSYFSILLLVAVGVLVFTGVQMLLEWDSFLTQDLHSWAGWGVVLLIAGHLLGIALHTVVKSEWIALAMVTGRKRGSPSSSSSSHLTPLPASLTLNLLFILWFVGGIVFFVQHYHAGTFQFGSIKIELVEQDENP